MTRQTHRLRATLLDTAEDVEAWLMEVGTKGPSLHPHAGDPNPYTTWNGWNYTVATGIDAEGMALTFEIMHFATGGSDFFVTLGTRSMGHDPRFVTEIEWPVALLDDSRRSVIEHPDYTPKED